MENVNLIELNDSELVKLSIDQKSNDAYGELVRRWMSAVKYSAYEITGNGDFTDDIAQEAFLVCWIKLHMLREYEKFGMWVCRTAKNHALNHMSRSTVNYSLDTVLNISSKRSSPENIFIVKETKEQIHSSLKNLPENLRKPAEMFYISGLSQKKIASLLDIPEGTVKRRLFDARNRLKSELEKLGVIEPQRDNKRTGDKIMKKESKESVEKIESKLYNGLRLSREQEMFTEALNAFLDGEFEKSKEYFIKTDKYIRKNNVSPHYIAANLAGLKAIDYLEKNNISEESHIILFKSFYGTRILHDSTQTKWICNPGMNSFGGLSDEGERPIERVYFGDVLLNVTIDHRLYFNHGMKVGDRIISEDGNSSIELSADNETITINAGTYMNCCKFIKTDSTRENYKVDIWYCPNVGLLKADFFDEGAVECYELVSCTINGGEGLLPFAKGNKWSYVLSDAPESLVQYIEYEVEEDDGNFASVSSVNIFSFKR